MSKILCLVALMVVLVVSAPPQAQAQDEEFPDCVNQLNPCGPFINSTTTQPPAECCQPLQLVLENDLSCICSVFGSVELIQSLNLNVTKAITLPQRCGLQIDIVAECEALLAPSQAPAISPSNSDAPATSSPSKAPASSALPLTPSEGQAMSPSIAPAGQKTGGASNVAWNGSAILGSILVWATLMFY